MPTTTFFNLPPPKQEKLLRAAMIEFTRQPYGEVALSRIIKAAGIPRGSFYQYFTDKTDLFRYVLGYYANKLGQMMLDTVDACGGKLLEVPLALFDRMRDALRVDDQEFQVFLEVIRQNVAVNIDQILDFKALADSVIRRADWSGLDVRGIGERAALLDLLLSSTAQSLMAAACGKATQEQCRSHLSYKVAVIRRGIEIKEEPSC